MKNKIPTAVITAATNIAEEGEGDIKLIGTYNGRKVYSYVFTEALTIGLPELYLWDGHSISVVSGIEAEEVLGSISFSSKVS